MVRILCLHGMGCNPKILQWQLAHFMRALGPQVEWFFLEGEVVCEAAPGLEGVAPPPFLCYYPTVTTSELAMAHEQMNIMIEEEGPFDGVLGFSQGSALIASILLHHSLQKPYDRPPFNFAILFSGNLPFSPDHSLYLDLIDKYMDLLPVENTSSNGKNDKQQTFFSTLLETTPELRGLAFSSLRDTANGRATLSAMDADPRSEQSCRPYLPQWTQASIKIPTLHIIGTADPFAPQAKVLLELCSSKERLLVEHPGGHDIPREEPYLSTTVKLAQQVLERSKLFATGAIV